MIEIIPAILPEDLDDIESKMKRVVGAVPFVQIDVCDGDYVPSKTWPYGRGQWEEFESVVREDTAIPEWDNINFEVDLMVSAPDRDAFSWIKAGASRIIFHVGSHPEIRQLLEQIRRQYGRPEESSISVELGVAIDLDTSLQAIEEFLPYIDVVQQMGIAKVGYQYQNFDERAVARVAEIRKKYPELIISVDGGVNPNSARKLIEAGANRLISGSFVFESGDVKEAIEELRGV